MVRARCFACVMVLAAAVPALAQDAAARGRDAAELQELRRQVADVTLQLRAAQRQLEAIRDFLEEEDLDETFERWEKLRAELASERREIRRERARLQAAREALERTRRLNVEQAEAEREEAEAEARDAAAPDWSAQYQMGVVYEGGQELFVKTTDGSVFVDADQDIDRRNILVRGTFLNKSARAWRYTFEVRAGGVERFGRPRRIVGSWRYQTPLLDPGELHEFEVKMPVDDVSRVRILQIGNVLADRPVRVDPAADNRDDQTEGDDDRPAESREVSDAGPRRAKPVDAANRY